MKNVDDINVNTNAEAATSSMETKAYLYLQKQISKTRHDIKHAVQRNATLDETERLTTKMEVLLWLMLTIWGEYQLPEIPGVEGHR